MPTLQRDSLNLAESRKKKNDGEGALSPPPAKKPSAASRAGAASRTTSKPKPPATLMEDDDDDDRLGGGVGEDADDEIISASLDSKARGKQLSIKQIGLCAGVVVLVIVVFVLFLANRGGNEPAPEPAPTDATTQPVNPTPTPQDTTPAEIPTDTSLGVQDFTQDTNMTSDSPLTDPNDFTKDIHDLTVRVNYEVKSIQSIADMVSYTKHRGTWDGGLELYWLEVSYQEKKYVIQVPFAYYKELSDTGIIPVKMEALRIESETDGEYLTIISYMELDEATLKQIMRTQSRN